MMDELKKKGSKEYKIGRFLGRSIAVFAFFSILYLVLWETDVLNYGYSISIGIVIILYIVISTIVWLVKIWQVKR